MKISIEYVGLLTKFNRGIKVEKLSLPVGVTVSSLRELLIGRCSGNGRKIIERCSFLVNNKNADLNTPLHNGDTVVLILHMTGG